MGHLHFSSNNLPDTRLWNVKERNYAIVFIDKKFLNENLKNSITKCFNELRNSLLKSVIIPNIIKYDVFIHWSDP